MDIELQPGTIWNGRYRIAAKLGKGGMGAVFAAEDLKLQGKLRAIKIAMPSPSSDRFGYRDISEEARMLLRLSHPNLPHIMDCFGLDLPGQDMSCEAIVMEYIRGETAGERFQRYGRCMPFQEVLRIGLQLCSALAYLHRQTPQIIHRDLKPSNVMMEENGHVRLIDFGIARHYKNGQTQDTMLLGTPGFAAPEQARHDGQSDPRSDVFGLGALLYYLLSGGNCYDANGRERQPASRLLQSDVPAGFIAVLERMVMFRQIDRYGKMEDVELALRMFVSESKAANNQLSTQIAQGERIHISFAPLSAGAGSTFLAISTAKLLGTLGIACAAAEYPSPQPEWRALLGIADEKEQDGKGSGIAEWASDGVSWMAPKHGSFSNSAEASEKLAVRLRRTACAVTLTDISSHADLAEARSWMLQCRIVAVIADPFPAKWSLERLNYFTELGEQLRIRGGKLVWIANKDCKFNGRSEWMRMLPHRPIAAFPLLPAEQVLDAIWRGAWPTMDKRLRKEALPALRPIANEIKRYAK
ncbi:serine/threonine-protein kinase [Paenibacillus sp. NEAU-GSW1]|uniref:protein kinase domain-containing protein n=1 Tax=Paenibacillus sp. NEAU-GSW1 TaxID=2682486 RepID=UPI001563E61D|nr:serine/threonine-protein kinase [Paenibacillus sp. NEAU-GSW1]